jgi:hypothetical protein
MRRIGEWRYSSTHSLTSALDGGEWSVSRPGRFTPAERASGTHWIGGWVGPRAVLDAVVKRNPVYEMKCLSVNRCLSSLKLFKEFYMRFSTLSDFHTKICPVNMMLILVGQI